MTNHSFIVDDFFKNPNEVKRVIESTPMVDYKFKDGVTYPDIVPLAPVIDEEMVSNLKTLLGPKIEKVLSFARYSFRNKTPPNWAHSDRNISQWLGLIYMNDLIDYATGTHLLKHQSLGIEKHPKNEFEKSALLNESNLRENWKIIYTCPPRYNRLLVLNADLIHAAGESYGVNRHNGRLVVSVFFNG